MVSWLWYGVIFNFLWGIVWSDLGEEVRKLEGGRKEKRETKRGSWVGVISVINFKFYLNLSFFCIVVCTFFFN